MARPVDYELRGKIIVVGHVPCAVCNVLRYFKVWEVVCWLFGRTEIRFWDPYMTFTDLDGGNSQHHNPLLPNLCEVSHFLTNPNMAISLASEEEFDNVVFIGLPKDSFLVRIASREDGTRITLENKGTKEQWQATVANIGECGPHRLHPDAVLCNLKV
jgi:hypothetical protein